MKYCADTWFMLRLAQKDSKAIEIVNQTKQGKTHLIIPVVVYAETIKKLLHQGMEKASLKIFLSKLESAPKINIVDADKTIASEAAHISHTYGAPMIDSFVAATAKIYGCNVLLAKDDHYRALTKNKFLKIQNW